MDTSEKKQVVSDSYYLNLNHHSTSYAFSMAIHFIAIIHTPRQGTLAYSKGIKRTFFSFISPFPLLCSRSCSVMFSDPFVRLLLNLVFTAKIGIRSKHPTLLYHPIVLTSTFAKFIFHEAKVAD